MIITIKDKDYELKLTAMSCMKIEKELGTNPLNIFMNATNDIPSLSNLITIIKHTIKGNYSTEVVCNSIDEWFEEGHTVMDLFNIVIGLFQESGFIPKDNNSKN